MRTLRIREIKRFVQVHTACEGQNSFWLQWCVYKTRLLRHTIASGRRCTLSNSLPSSGLGTFTLKSPGILICFASPDSLRSLPVVLFHDLFIAVYSHSSASNHMSLPRGVLFISSGLPSYSLSPYPDDFIYRSDHLL